VATAWPVTGIQDKTGSGVAGAGLADGGRWALGTALTLQAAERASGPAWEELGWRRIGWGRRGGGGQAGAGRRRWRPEVSTAGRGWWSGGEDGGQARGPVAG
jgi:hypothetical protein